MTDFIIDLMVIIWLIILIYLFLSELYDNLQTLCWKCNRSKVSKIYKHI